MEQELADMPGKCSICCESYYHYVDTESIKIVLLSLIRWTMN